MGIIRNEITVQIIGLIGTAIFFCSFQCKKTKVLFMLQLVSSVFFSLHFFLLGAYTGLLLNMVEIIRNYFLFHGQKKWASHPASMIVIMLIMAICGAISWNGWISLLPTAATVVGTLFLWTQNGKILRFAQLFYISPCWLFYNIVVGSIAGAFTEIFIIISVVVSLYRFGLNELNNTCKTESA